MNHLHQLLESATPEWIAFESLLRPSETAVIKKAVAIAQNAICFDMGDIAELDGLRVIPELVRLPYDLCWFEVQVGAILTGFLCTSGEATSDHEIACAIFDRSRGEWSYCGPLEIYAGSSFGHPHEGEVEHRATSAAATILSAFLSALNCSNVHRREHLPDAPLQKARKKRGKPPLFSYYTLELDIDDDEEDSAGAAGKGTGIRQRLHLVRGHAQRYGKGKEWRWKQPFAKSDKKLGLIHKDYAVKRPKQKHEQLPSDIAADIVVAPPLRSW